MGNEVFLCEHITEHDLPELKGFTSGHVKGGFLAEYIKAKAFRDELEHLSRTYVVRDKATGEVAMYFSLKAGFVSVNESMGVFRRSFDSVPGIELANFAANGEYKRRHPEYKGFGKLVFKDFIIPCAQEAAGLIGIKYLYIFALPEESLIRNYAGYGFLRLPKRHEAWLHRRIKPRYDHRCIFMYQSL